MPEGDTILRAARVLHRALGGSIVTKFEPRTAPAARAIQPGVVTLSRVEAAGKNLLMFFDDDFVLRTHMRMSGAWHLYRHGERWRAPRRAVRAVLETADWVAIAVDVPEFEWARARDLAHHGRVAALGPDVLRDPFDMAEALRRFRAHPNAAVADVLLDQTVIAGVGNIYKSETMFAARRSPHLPVSSLGDAEIRRIVEIAKTVMRANVAAPGAHGRVTTGRMNPAQRLWVYRRAGRPCRVCGAPIASRRTGPDARTTYWCPACQPTITP